MDAHLKVSRAVTKAAFAHPFWGSLMLAIGHIESDEIPTAATDGKKIMWCRDFIDELTEPETLGVMAHEICHVIFQHCQPWEGKDQRLCNIAMDYVINNILLDDGLSLPKEGVIDHKREFVGMTWQQVYAILDDVKDKHDGGTGNGSADNAGMSEDRQAELGKEISDLMKNENIMDVIENSNLSEEDKAELKQKVIQAAQNAKSAGIGSLPGGLDDLIDEIRTSKVDWREFLITSLANKYPEDYTFARPNKKFLGAYDLYMPTMEGVQVGTIAVGLDTSGSVSRDEITDFLAELNEITRMYTPEKVYVFYCDCDVAHEEVYEMGEEIDTLNTRGGGGTSFVPVFEHIEDNNIQVDQMIYFSDMEVGSYCFPEKKPNYDVLWVSTRKKYEVPFGTLIKIGA